MNAYGRRLFLALIAGQAMHSLEEYRYALWEVLAPARFVSGLVSTNLPLGFATVNALIVAFGAWCYAVPIRGGRRSARRLAAGWAILEGANGAGHLLFALAAGGYFPGAWTAPWLLASAILLGRHLQRTGGGPAEA